MPQTLGKRGPQPLSLALKTDRTHRTPWKQGLVFLGCLLIAGVGEVRGASHIQAASNSDVTGKTYTSFAVKFVSANTSGNAIILGVTFGNVNPTITASDIQGNTYSQVIKTYDSGHRQGSAILYATNIKGGASNQVTVTFSSAVAYLALGIHEYGGIAATSALDGSAGTTASGSGPSSGSATTTANGDLIFGIAVEDSTGHGDTFTAGSGFTKRVDLGNVAAYADEDETQISAGSIGVTWTLAPPSNWIASLAAFKASSSGGSTPPSITGLSPTAGVVGSPVTISGANFGATQGTSTVTFNGKTGTPTSWGLSSITVPVPAGAGPGNVVVRVGGLASNAVSFTVNKVTPTITWATPGGINYGTPLSATQLNATGSVPGVFVYTPPPGTVLGAGTQTLSATFTPTDTTDYTTATQTATLTVGKATPTITWATPVPINYGTPLSATQLNATGSVPGVFAYTPPPGTVLGAGTQTLSATFTPTDTTDYTTATQMAPLTVGKATPTITWAMPGGISYGTPLSATQLNATGSVPGAFVYTPPPGTVLGAGTQTLSATFTPTDTTDSTAATQTVTLTVGQATLTVTASNVMRAYGTPNPAFAATFTGFVNGDGPSVLSGFAALSTTAAVGSPVGSYAITAGVGTLAAEATPSVWSTGR